MRLPRTRGGLFISSAPADTSCRRNTFLFLCRGFLFPFPPDDEIRDRERGEGRSPCYRVGEVEHIERRVRAERRIYPEYAESAGADKRYHGRNERAAKPAQRAAHDVHHGEQEIEQADIFQPDSPTGNSLLIPAEVERQKRVCREVYRRSGYYRRDYRGEETDADGF